MENFNSQAGSPDILSYRRAVSSMSTDAPDISGLTLNTPQINFCNRFYTFEYFRSISSVGLMLLKYSKV